MTIAEQLTAVRDALLPWADEIKGRVEIAADPVHLLGILATAPGAPRVVVMFEAGDPRGEYETGREDRKYLVVVSRGRGFRLDPGDALTQGVAGGKPLYDLIEEAREMVRSLRFEEDEPVPVYKGTHRLQLEELSVDAYQIEFTVGTQLPEHE